MLMLTIAAGLGAASPTYLACSIDQAGENLTVEIVADEASRRAIVSLPSGRVVERVAVFSPTSVRIDDEPTVWIIDRSNLSITRTVNIREPRTYNGKCEVKPAPEKRAF